MPKRQKAAHHSTVVCMQAQELGALSNVSGTSVAKHIKLLYLGVKLSWRAKVWRADMRRKLLFPEILRWTDSSLQFT